MAASVLYVDDEEDNITVFEALYDALLPIRTARSGEAAVAILRREEIGVLLTDQRMPGMSGIDLAEAVHREFPDIVTILITAYGDLAAASDAINRGEVHRYLRKPWDAADLELALREALSVYATRRRVANLERSLHDLGRVYALDVVSSALAETLRPPITSLEQQLGTARDLLDRADRTPGAGAGLPLARAREELGRAAESLRWMNEIVAGTPYRRRGPEVEEDVDVAEIVGTVLRMIKGASSRRARVTFESLPAVKIRANATKIGQIVLNLTMSALHSFPMRPSGENQVKIQVRGEPGGVLLTVEDNGVGIPEEHQDRIFDPFFTQHRDVGSGLGLAIARTIVLEYGGDLQFSSRPGSGTRFRVRLPVEPPTEPPETTDPVARTARGGSHG